MIGLQPPLKEVGDGDQRRRPCCPSTLGVLAGQFTAILLRLLGRAPKCD
jgi:hypothetical protein